MADKNTAIVRIRGREFRIRGSEDDASLQRIAAYLEETMARLEERTRTVDSLDVALLTALNLAREVVELREGGRGGAADAKRLRPLIELAESAVRGRPQV